MNTPTKPNLLCFDWDKEKHFSQADFQFQGFCEKNANAELWIRSENSAHLEAVPEIFKYSAHWRLLMFSFFSAPLLVNLFLFWLTFKFCLIIVVNCLHLVQLYACVHAFNYMTDYDWHETAVVVFSVTAVKYDLLACGWKPASNMCLSVCEFTFYLLTLLSLLICLKQMEKPWHHGARGVCVSVFRVLHWVLLLSLFALTVIKRLEGSRVRQQHLEEWMEPCLLVVGKRNSTRVCVALCIDILDFSDSCDATSYPFFLCTSVTPSQSVATNQWFNWQNRGARHSANVMTVALYQSKSIFHITYQTNLFIY